MARLKALCFTAPLFLRQARCWSMHRREDTRNLFSPTTVYLPDKVVVTVSVDPYRPSDAHFSSFPPPAGDISANSIRLLTPPRSRMDARSDWGRGISAPPLSRPLPVRPSIPGSVLPLPVVAVSISTSIAFFKRTAGSAVDRRKLFWAPFRYRSVGRSLNRSLDELRRVLGYALSFARGIHTVQLGRQRESTITLQSRSRSSWSGTWSFSVASN